MPLNTNQCVNCEVKSDLFGGTFGLLILLLTRVLLQTVFVRSVERNAANIYEARHHILGLTNEAQPAIGQYDEPMRDNCPDLNSNRQLCSPLSFGKILFAAALHWTIRILLKVSSFCKEIAHLVCF